MNGAVGRRLVGLVLGWDFTMRLCHIGVPGIRERGWHHATLMAYATPVVAGKMPGLGNQVLRECGREIEFYPGLPKFFDSSRAWARAKREGALHQLELLWGETMQRINEITEPYEKL